MKVDAVMYDLRILFFLDIKVWPHVNGQVGH